VGERVRVRGNMRICPIRKVNERYRASTDKRRVNVSEQVLVNWLGGLRLGG
jgi:hypothetical protein